MRSNLTTAVSLSSRHFFWQISDILVFNPSPASPKGSLIEFYVVDVNKGRLRITASGDTWEMHLQITFLDGGSWILEPGSQN